MVHDNLEIFNGKFVSDFIPNETQVDFTNHTYRLRLDFDSIENGSTIDELIHSFAQLPNIHQCQELIIGQWSFDSGSEGVVNALVNLKEGFKNLKTLFIGDITYEEQEISWIQQSDLSPILAAYPNLELLQIRGGTSLSFSNLKHDNLKSLIIQTGGLPPNVIEEINNSHLPNLEKLELWLGDENYGFESKIEDLDIIINAGKFPKLTYLGLKNSFLQDEIAIKISQSRILGQLHTLDLSMGTLTDLGANALLRNPAISNLHFLNLDHHYMSDEMMEQIKSLGIPVSMNDREVEDDGYRYIEVSE
ncbi:STM4015 family protein [Emticicia aquatilis]|nr:STM4015 family protein [Emticicia aquatilis]